jgi:hypothetical protein
MVGVVLPVLYIILLCAHEHGKMHLIHALICQNRLCVHVQKETSMHDDSLVVTCPCAVVHMIMPAAIQALTHADTHAPHLMLKRMPRILC